MREVIMPILNLKLATDVNETMSKSGKIQISDEIALTNFDVEELGDHDHVLSEAYKHILASAHYSLKYLGAGKKYDELIYTHLLMWCIKQPRTQVPFLFISDDTSSQGFKVFDPKLYMVDKVTFDNLVENQKMQVYNKSDFSMIKKMMNNYYAMKSALKRKNVSPLINAMNFLHLGLQSRSWETQAVLYSVALESLFSFSSQEITHRISENIARFHGATKDERLDLYEKTVVFYKYRSKVVHGKQPKKLKKDIIHWARDIVKKSIVEIMQSQELISIYNDQNAARKHFKNIVLS